MAFRKACLDWVNDPKNAGKTCDGFSRRPLTVLAAIAWPEAKPHRLTQHISEELGKTRGIVRPHPGKRALGTPTCTSVGEMKKKHDRVNPINNPATNAKWGPINSAKLKARNAEYARRVGS